LDRSAAGIARRIRLAREGRTEVLGELLEGYRNYLRLMAATTLEGRVRGKADASDVVQETLLKAHENFHQFRGTTEGEWVAWMRRILARNVAELHRRYALPGRRVDRERSLEASMERSSAALRDLVPGKAPTPSEGAVQRERSVMLADALADMEPEDREVVILRNLNELSWSDIAERTGKSPDAARMLWVRALQRMGPMLKERLA
jgi:RNA polymerase sigma-70 factor (ECF subfamily)